MALFGCWVKNAMSQFIAVSIVVTATKSSAHTRREARRPHAIKARKDNSMKSAIRILWILVCCSICSGYARAHDTWVQTNTQVVRAGEAVFVDLMLGNH